MTKPSRFARYAGLAAFAGVGLATANAAWAQIAPASITPPRITVAPYAWMTGVTGETGVRDLSAEIDVPFSDLFSHLRFAAMGTLEGGYGPWLGSIDLAYSSLEANRTRSIGSRQIDLEFTMSLFIANALIGYAFAPSSALAIDVLAGGRLWAVDASLNVSGDSARAARSRDPTWVDAVGGLRVRWLAADRWQLNFAANAGGGGSKSTAEALTTLRYGIADRWAVFASYRYLRVDYHKNDYFFDGDLAGPALGVVYFW